MDTLGKVFLGTTLALLLCCAYLLHKNHKQHQETLELAEFTARLLNVCKQIERERDYYKRQEDTI